MRLTRILLCAFALLAAGCAGGDDDGDGNADAPVRLDPAAYGTATPEPGQVLLDFVHAAGKGDADTMWSLLSEPTQASIGPTLDDFRAGTATELREGLGTLAGTAEVILSRRLPGDWGVAAIAGERELEGEKEYFAYGTALVGEEGQWKLELGGVVISGLKPDPLAETDAQPVVAANVGAGGDIDQLLMWLDGEPLAVDRTGDSPFAAALQGRPEEPLKPGRHQVIAFGSTELTASAVAWTFSVQG